MARTTLPRFTALALLTLLAGAVLFLAAGPSAGKAAAAKQGKGPRAAIGAARTLGRDGACNRFARPRISSRPRLAARQRKMIRKRIQRCAKKPTKAMGPTGPLYWGAWIGSQLTGTEAPWDRGAIAKFESMTGKAASAINFSSPFADCSGSECSFYKFPKAEMEGIRTHGSMPFFSWASQSTPASLNQPDFQLADVIAGNHDAYIREFAEGARDWGHPFFLRFNWEMNGNWFAWMEGVNGNQPGEYVAAWRHVHDIFEAVGATNATWVWCPNVDPYDKLGDLKALYPGDEYVDWTGLDGYNWGTNPASNNKGWMSFDELFRSTYDEITQTIAPGKPLIISEIGSTEHGGSKAAWIADALHSARTNYPQLRGLLWFEKFDDGMDWPIETSSSAAGAFAAGIQDPAYLANGYATAGPGTIQPAS